MVRSSIVSLALLLPATVLGAQGQPQAPPPVTEHVVVTGSAAPVSFAEASRSVFVITREQIARLPVRSIDELLSYLASVDVRSRGPGGVQADFSIRGASFAQALVLVDGVRLNDAQSGHHNGDIPVLLADIERIELLAGPAASLYGADAFGGAIHVITARGPLGRRATVSGGSFGSADASIRADLPIGGRTHSAGAAFSRSDGFTDDRDYRTFTLAGRVKAGPRTTLSAAHLDKEFGANGFYGPSPSREWTTQTLVSGAHEAGVRRGWETRVQASYRTHGDRFLWDVRRPGQFENRHRTHAATIAIGAARVIREGTRVHVGVDAGGDWIRSSNLGDHALGRGSVFAEWRQRAGARGALASSLRYDGYSRYGSAWSPALSGSYWLGAPLKVRASVGHAFRVPTFTELYYTDPAHRASDHLDPERGWTWEGGLDWLPAPRWMGSLTVFARRERGVIDWVRDTPQERWRTANVQRLATEGIEVAARRSVGADGSVDVQYAWLQSEGEPVAALSKYVLDYAAHRAVASASLGLPARFGAGGRIGYTRRVDGREYALLDLRLSRDVGRARLFVEGTNLLDAEYEEIRGVAMPGRSLRAGLELLRF